MASLSDTHVLASFLRVDREMEKDVILTLRRMASAVERDLRSLAAQKTFSARIEADQKRLILTAIRQREAQGWTAIGHTVSAAQADAAAAAVNATQDYVDLLLRQQLSAAERRALREAAIAQAQRTVDAAVSRELVSKVPLSTRVYRARDLASGQIDRMVTNALGRGLNARQIAREAARFISPDTPGGTSYAAMRLGRTEINNAFHATQVNYARTNPFITAMKWNLSGSHKRPDECNQYADHDPYDPADVPQKPHPQCFCYLTPETIDDATFVRNFLAGRYDDLVAK